VRAAVTETAIELSWNAPARTSIGGTPPAIAGYRVYRAEVDPASPTSQDLAKIKLKAPLTLLASTRTTSYRDTQFEFGRTYLYSIRSIFSTDSTTVESADSTPVIIAPLDIFPPAAPRNLVAVFVPAIAEMPEHVELSWGISPETDLAGYHVYRSERDGERGDRLTSELLPAPTFRDMSVSPGHRYRYQVTAVDRAGNESVASMPVSIELPQRAR
jgi:fibronectin type 3 domain-containing protein